MTLPAPRSTFTIPSLHDDLELECRIYYPRISEKTTARLGHRFAIIAHPYAPLGGSYDDPVVALAGSVLLKHGITLGTFNFRGAHGSGGRTSWSGKAELADYVAFYGFMLCYMNYVQDGLDPSRSSTDEDQPAPQLILGGYSYGSLITSCLPPLELVSMLFQQTQDGSAESEIKIRAEQLGRDLVGYVEVHKSGALSVGRSPVQSTDGQNSPSRGLAVGGFDSDTATRRMSREASRRSLDTEKIRKSLDRTRQRMLGRTKSDQEISSPSTPGSSSISKRVEPKIVYLVISPVLPPISGFTTMFSKPTFERLDLQTRKIVVKDTTDKDEKFAKCPSCLIYGTKDIFTSSKRVQKWARDLQTQAGSTLMAYEIEGAGHFWIETDAAPRLQASISRWLTTLD